MYYDGYKKKEGLNYFQYSSTAQSISKVFSSPHIYRINIFQTKNKNFSSIWNLFLLSIPLSYYIMTILLPQLCVYIWIRLDCSTKLIRINRSSHSYLRLSIVVEIRNIYLQHACVRAISTLLSIMICCYIDWTLELPIVDESYVILNFYLVSHWRT